MKLYQTSSMKPTTPLSYLTRILFFFGSFSIVLMVGFTYKVSFIHMITPSTILNPLFQLPPTPISPLPENDAPLMYIHKEKMSDEDLMRRASEVGLSSFNGNFKAKVAFMFLVKGPLPLAPLWDRFFQGHNGYYSIYVHAHPSYQTPFPNDSVFYGTNIHSQEVKWGTSSMVEAERRLLANAFLDPSNQRFVLLSESCIPLFNFQVVYDYLFKTSLSFLDCRDIPGKDGRGRYNQSMSPQVEITQFRKGGQWFEAHRELALNILLENKLYGVFKQHCFPPCYNDEHYLPTMAYILYPGIIHNRSLTWIDWSRGEAHPSSFGLEDISVEFLNRVKFGSNCTYNREAASVCFLFARKFLNTSLQPLLRIAPLILGFGY